MDYLLFWIDLNLKQIKHKAMSFIHLSVYIKLNETDFRKYSKITNKLYSSFFYQVISNQKGQIKQHNSRVLTHDT